MTMMEGVDTHEVEAWLVNKIRSKGLISLRLEEVHTAHRSKTFADEWWRITGEKLPAEIRSQMQLRLSQCGRLRDDNALSMGDTEGAGAAFLRAISNGEIEVVSRGLLSRERRRLMCGVDAKHRGCLHLASLAGHAELVQLLHDHGADLEARDRNHRTPLHLACEHGRKEAAGVLLAYDCQAGAQDATKRTALHYASCCGEPQISKLLSQRDSNLISSLDEHCRTPLFYAILNLHPTAMAEITKHLLELRAEPNAPDSYGMMPLHYAAEAGKKEAVSLLLQFLADPTIKDSSNHRSPMDLASRHEGVRQELQKAIASHKPGENGRKKSPPTATQNRVQVPQGGPGKFVPAGRPPGVQVPPALGAPFQVLRERFVKIMERVQEGGIEQMEHIKRPHLFTGSWMTDVSSHQQLFGQVLKYVPGPEVCIRIFNLLRPPSQFPVSCGDERDIIAIYEGQTASNPRSAWSGPDPYAAAPQFSEDVDDLSQARRVELLRAIHDREEKLRAAELQVEEFRRKVEGLQADIRERGEPGELQALREGADRARRQQASQSEEVETLEGRISSLQGQNRVLQEQLASEKERCAALLADQCSLRSQLQAVMTRRGEEQAYQELFEQERCKAESTQRQLETKLQETQAIRLSLEDSERALRTEVRRLQAELAQSAVSSSAAAEAASCRARADQLVIELDDVRKEMERVRKQAVEQEQTSRSEVLDHLQQRQDVERELGRLRADAKQVQELESEVAKLRRNLDNQDHYWRKMFREYPLIGQAFFGSTAANTASSTSAKTQDGSSIPPKTVQQ